VDPLLLIHRPLLRLLLRGSNLTQVTKLITLKTSAKSVTDLQNSAKLALTERDFLSACAIGVTESDMGEGANKNEHAATEMLG
jgi:hypothetical protein